MRVGIDTYTLSGLNLTPWEILTFVHAHGLEGVQFGSATAISRTLDHGQLAEFRQEADRHDLHLELGIPQVNPHRLARNAAVLRAGESDAQRGLECYIRAARAAGCTELHSAVGGLADRLPGPGQLVIHNDGQGRLVAERFSTRPPDPSLTWPQQLADTVVFLRGFGPLLRELGCRINLETHADATTFELVRMVEELGPDVQGINLDIANTMNELEDPVAAAQRAAPYAHNTHTKDGLLFFTEGGLAWQPRACGDGVVPLDAIVPILAAHQPQLMLAIEDHKWIYELPIYDPEFLACHPDLTPRELAALVRLARIGQGRIDRGETTEPRRYEEIPWPEHQVARIDAACAYLKRLRDECLPAGAPAR